MSDLPALETAAAALGDEYARQLRACKEVMETEQNVHIWRVAANRYAELKARKSA